jgi:hypothetical protein
LSQGLQAIRRRLDYKGPVVSLEDMNAAVLQEAKTRSQR